MKYAKLVKLGGELIEAKDADYQDYYGILTCPECGEPVFLRKGHQRGDTVFRAAFVHHRAIPEVSACEMRVGKYSQEYVARVAGEARNQRLRMLEISMWKYLKTSCSIDLDGDNVSYFVKAAKTKLFERESFKVGLSAIKDKQIFLSLMDEYLEQDIKEIVAPADPSGNLDGLHNLLAARKKDWKLHGKIAREALELFLSSDFLKEVRTRILATLGSSDLLATVNPIFFSLDQSSEAWRKFFSRFVASTTVVIFISVDWIKVLDPANQKEFRKASGFVPFR